MEYSSFTLAIEPLIVQVMVLRLPTSQFSEPLGAVRVRAPTILKLASDLSVTDASPVSVTRTLIVEEMALGIVQAKVPDAPGVEAIIVVFCSSSLKPFEEYSSFTLVIVPVFVQVIFCTVPTTHASGPLGAVRAREPLTVKALSESSATEVSAASVTLTFKFVPMASGMVQGYEPATAPVEAIIVFG